MRMRHCVYLLSLIFFISACSSTRKVPAGDALYVGAQVKIESDSLSARKKKELRGELGSLTRPRPNKKILGLRLKLFFYNLGGWARKNLGEPPVLLSSVNLDWNTKVLQSNMENRGFFFTQVQADTTVRRRKATAIYTVRPGAQYFVNKVEFEQDSTNLLKKTILASTPGTLLKPNDPFDLAVIKGERDRIDNYVKEHGFYYFDPDFLIIKVDTTIGNHLVNMYVQVKPNIPPQSWKSYRINDVFIYPNYRLSSRDTTGSVDTAKENAEYYKGYYLVDKQHRYKPILFSQAMQFNPGDIYNRTDHTQSISRLVNLNIFKFVKNRFEDVSTTDSALLNAYYYLTPLPKKSLRGEINASTKSNNLTGSSITLGWRNRNTFRGGELLAIDFSGAFEVQISGLARGYNTFRIGAEPSLTFPRFLVPFTTINTRGGYVPRTKLLLGYDILNKQKLYTMNSFRAGLGYSWKENIKIEHVLNPIAINYIQPLLVTQEYKDSILTNPTLEKAIEKQFILGSDYNYTYNELLGSRPMSGIYFSGTVDVSGNIAGLITGANAKAGRPKTIAGAEFSQYAKFETDFRYYAKVSPGSVWANRLIIGAGFPYGNSRELPFIKQFFVGGTNSIRAFRSRSLGPGTYQMPSSTGFRPDQSGDMKLEINTELRTKLSGIFHSALFIDAGNIWLYNNNPDKPGAQFSSDFLKELAVGGGVGLRFDISFLVIRLDVAIPLRKPWLAEGQRWVIKDIDFGDAAWRRENIIFNIGIGYPF